MAIPALPASGSTDWYPWAQAVHRSALGNVFDVRNFGAVADGVTDDRAAIQAAVDAAVASLATGRGAVVQLAPGVHLLGSSHPTPPSTHPGAALGIRLPVNLASRLVIRGYGVGVSTIRLSSNARCAFWIGQNADYDVFRNVTIEDLDVDNANAPGRCHVLIGSQPEYDTTQKNLSFADLTFRRLRTYGYTQDATQGTQYKAFIGLHGDHPAGAPIQATQTSSVRIVVEDVAMTDVQSGVLVDTIYGNGATNHWYDQIRIARCSHVISSWPAATLQQTSYFICGAGVGEYCEFVDCYSENSGDDGIEVGAMQRIVIKGFRVKNPYLMGIYVRQAQSPPDADQQTITITDYAYAATTVLNSGAGNPVARPLSFVSDDAAAWMGTINIERPSVSYDGVRLTKLSRGSQKDIGLLLEAPARRMVVDGLRLYLRGFVFDAAFSDDYNLIQPNLTPPTLAAPNWQYSPGQFILRNAEVEVTTPTNPTTFLTLLHVLWPLGQGSVDVDGLNIQVNRLTLSGGGGTINLVQIGRGGTLGLIRLRGIRALADTVPVSRNGIVLNSTGTYQGLDIDGCDFRSWTTNAAADLSVAAGPAGVGSLLNIGRLNRWANTGTTNYGGHVVTGVSTTLAPTATSVGVNSTAAPRTITLPAADRVPVGPENAIRIKDESGAASATNTITVVPPSGTIDGAASKVISTAYGSVAVYSTGTTWLTA